MYTIMDLMVSVGWQLAGAFGRSSREGRFLESRTTKKGAIWNYAQVSITSLIRDLQKGWKKQQMLCWAVLSDLVMSKWAARMTIFPTKGRTNWARRWGWFAPSSLGFRERWQVSFLKRPGIPWFSWWKGERWRLCRDLSGSCHVESWLVTRCLHSWGVTIPKV